MKVTGIIAEYNPFHNGHEYHLMQTKAQTGADYVVVVMSGNFTQRGIPALLSKYVRAKHALLAGADLVLELPMPYAVSSAEYFALGGCSLLDQLGVVDTLCFGMEQTDLDALKALSSIISKEPELYQNLLRQKLSEGLSFPRAQQEALHAYDSSLNISMLESPNNRLALEYLKALTKLNSSISPFPVKRIGKGYDDTDLSNEGSEHYSSASSIRKYIADTTAAYTDHSSIDAKPVNDELSNHVPAYVWSDLEQLLKEKDFLLTDDLDLLLHYKLLQQSLESLQTYLDVNADIANKILNHLPSYISFDSFCELLKSKDLTYTRISRLLLHILLDLKKTDMDILKQQNLIPYARILGFRKDASPLLHQIKKVSNLPLISKLADASKNLSYEAMSILDKEIAASHIYEAVLSSKANKPLKNEFTQPIQII